jgi:hypothetical protein
MKFMMFLCGTLSVLSSDFVICYSRRRPPTGTKATQREHETVQARISACPGYYYMALHLEWCHTENLVNFTTRYASLCEIKGPDRTCRRNRSALIVWIYNNWRDFPTLPLNYLFRHAEPFRSYLLERVEILLSDIRACLDEPIPEASGRSNETPLFID